MCSLPWGVRIILGSVGTATKLTLNSGIMSMHSQSRCPVRNIGGSISTAASSCATVNVAPQHSQNCVQLHSDRVKCLACITSGYIAKGSSLRADNAQDKLFNARLSSIGEGLVAHGKYAGTDWHTCGYNGSIAKDASACRHMPIFSAFAEEHTTHTTSSKSCMICNISRMTLGVQSVNSDTSNGTLSICSMCGRILSMPRGSFARLDMSKCTGADCSVLSVRQLSDCQCSCVGLVELLSPVAAMVADALCISTLSSDVAKSHPSPLSPHDTG